MKYSLLLLSAVLLLSCRKTENKLVQKEELPSQNIALVIDKSLSMYSIDFKPNRSEAVLNVLKNVISSKKDNQAFSIVVFAGDSYLICPLTKNKQELLTAIDKATKQITYLRPLKLGTSFSHALMNALYSLKGRKGQNSILFFSDGNTTIDSYPINIPINEAVSNHIPINSIVITPKDFAVSPVRLDLNNNLGFEKIKAIHVDTIKAKQIPFKTGGIFKIFYTQKDFDQFDLKKIIDNTNYQLPANENPVKTDPKDIINIYLEIEKRNDSITKLYP
ncbi:VWA domain-containing protein [Chryseobacterium oranimense]|uniref:vWA domain-containing protein n=1 Tax=Chryseobacterium oranimense TaxID=421058 RepID=UPI0021AFC983|nr:VWA domain-containing protein [Chryseobacterium oranimense]UWX61070.1 VWA domain-containing protein [Chryseobacterium oranimense]